MKKVHTMSSRVPGLFLMRKICLLAVLAVASGSVSALESLDDAGMSSVSGAGLAFAMDDFSFRMAPTSYLELTGSDPYNVAGGATSKGWVRGDARYYGMSLTNGENTGGMDWYGTSASGCTGTGVNCPIGSNNAYGIRGFSSIYNPFVLRVFQYDGFNYEGTRTTSTGSGSTLAPTVLEFIGPSMTDPYRWSFWGEMEVGRNTVYATSTAASGIKPYSFSPTGAGCLATGNTAFCGLQSQTTILGKPIASGKKWNGVTDPNNYTAGTIKPAILRLMQTDYNSDTDVRGTLGITYQSALSGDFRFSVRQKGSTNTGLLHQVPDFSDTEGLFFKNVDAYMPFGTLHYQSIIFGGASRFDATASPIALTQNGNFVIELTRIPNIPDIYNNFYCGTTTTGTTAASCDGAASNPDTHAYVRWGNWASPTATQGTTATSNPTGTSTANGIYFSDGAATPSIVNIGNARIEGMLIHHLKITTLGAGI